MKRRPTYREIDREEVAPGNPIDVAVHRRTRRPREERRLARAAQAVVDALGRRRRVWFVYEEVLGRITSRQQAAYLDLGVEHEVAAARAQELLGASKRAREIAARLVREVVGASVADNVRVEAAVLAVWAMVGIRVGAPGKCGPAEWQSARG